MVFIQAAASGRDQVKQRDGENKVKVAEGDDGMEGGGGGGGLEGGLHGGGGWRGGWWWAMSAVVDGGEEGAKRPLMWSRLIRPAV